MRYIRLYANFLRFSISRALEFRLDFFFRVIMDGIYYATNIAFFKILFLHTGQLAGWNESQVMIFVAGYLVLDGLQMTVFSNNLWLLPQLVNRGDLDYYLLRPVSPLFFLSLRDFAANSFLNLILAGSVMAWAISNYSEPVTAMQVIFYFLFLLNGLVLYYFFRLLSVLPVFWTGSGQGLDILFWHFTRFLERPDGIFNGTVRIVLTTVLPYCLMVSYPARIFFYGLQWPLIAHMLIVTGVLSLFVAWIWRLALKHYSSASS
jgi:ABC-2 type transport system permease protein